MRRVVQIKAGADITLDAAHQLAVGAARPSIGFFGLVHLVRERFFVERLLNIDMAGAVRGDLHLGALAYMQAGRIVVERVGTVYIVGLVIPLDGALAIEYQCGQLLLGFFERVGVAVLHDEECNVHHGILADTFIQTDVLVVSALDLLINVHNGIPSKKRIFGAAAGSLIPDTGG